MKKQFIGIVLGCSFFLYALSGQSAPYEEVRVVGETEVVGQNYASAREEAIGEAMNEGILKVSEDFFNPSQFSQIKDIIEVRLGEKRRRLVKDYRLLGETRKGGNLEVELLVVPLKDQVRRELIRWGILFDRIKRPTFFIQPFEGSQGAIWAQRIQNRLADLGYLSASSKEEADVLLSGEIGKEGRKSIPAQITIEMKNVQKRSSRRKVSLQKEWEEREMAGFLATAALGKVIPPWLKMVGSGRVYEIEVSGLRNNLPLRELRKMLNSDEWGFSEGKDAEYSAGSVVFETVFDGEMGKLVKTLAQMKVAGDSLKVVDVKDRKVKVEIVKR